MVLLSTSADAQLPSSTSQGEPLCPPRRLFVGHEFPHLPWRFLEPSMKSVGECARFAIAQEPCNFRDRQVFVLQIAFRQLKLQLVQNAGEG